MSGQETVSPERLKGRLADLWKRAKRLGPQAPDGIFDSISIAKEVTDNPLYPIELYRVQILLEDSEAEMERLEQIGQSQRSN